MNTYNEMLGQDVKTRWSDHAWWMEQTINEICPHETDEQGFEGMLLLPGFSRAIREAFDF